MVTEAEMMGDSQRKEYEDSAVLLSREGALLHAFLVFLYHGVPLG